MFYVYKLIDPSTNLPFYIGKGKGRRSRVHFNPSTNGQNPYKDAVINQIRSAGQDIIIEHVQCADEESAYILERQLIEQYGRRDNGTGILTNLQNGGEGAGSGRVLSQNTRSRISASLQGTRRSNASHGGTEVIQYNLEGQELARYPSSRVAAKATGINGSYILYCCQGLYASTKGYVWKFAAPDNRVPRSKLLKHQVIQSDLNGNIIKVFDSISAAAREMNTGVSYISRAAVNNDIAFGYRWSKITHSHTDT